MTSSHRACASEWFVRTFDVPGAKSCPRPARYLRQAGHRPYVLAPASSAAPPPPLTSKTLPAPVRPCRSRTTGLWPA